MPDRSGTTDPMPLVVLGPNEDPLVGREVGGYIIEVALGEGGMGLVYQARHPFLGRRFAIKVLRPEFAADLTLSSNFVREAQTLSGLKHPHIIDIVGFGPLDEQRQYMVTEFLDGRTLEAELAEQGKLSISRVLALSDQILDGLEAAHSIDVIHRDLKPSNVFLARQSGGAEVVKLLDFGLAKLQPQALTGGEAISAARSVISGTPAYIAPEQALGRGVSKLSDLYSFGVVLFELLKGEKLFAAGVDSLDPVYELLQHHLYKPAPRLGGDFPEELDQLVADLLEKDAVRRPQSVQLVRQRLRRIGRDLQREETRQGQNPLLARTLRAVPEVDPQVLVPSRKVPVAVAVFLGLALLGPGLWWLTRGEAVAPGSVPVPVVVVMPPPPPPAPVVVPAPAVVAEDELAPLASIAMQKKPVTPKRPVVAEPLSSCEPTERWRTASRNHLQELQQLAASRNDPRVWTRFEDAEGALSSSIGVAASGAECAAVERRIQQLAKELSR